MSVFVQRTGLKARQQRGAALMVMLIVLVLGFVTLLVKSLTSADIRNERQARTSTALAQAKEALIGYAITYGDKPDHIGEVHGYLPCPDVDGSNGEGSSLTTCGSQNVSQLGRLPWRTLGLEPLRDGDNECLWYAVSGTYKNSPKTKMMNWDTNGQLQAYAADGTRLDSNNNQVVAVIIAPGTVQTGEDRSGTTAPICGGNYTAAAYLDNDTVNSINNADVATGKFIQGERNGLVNDNIVFITRQDLWNAMLKRSDFTNTLKLLTQRTAECLADYGRENDSGSSNKSIPWPSPIPLADYAVNNYYNDSSGIYSGRVPHRVNTSNSTTNNDMSGDYLMTNNGLNCPYYSATPSTELERLYPWWDNWKDHLFYALSYEYRPKNSSTNSCGNCIEIDGSGNYAGVVMFAGSSLSTQPRASTTTNNSERGVLSNYLEGRNESNHPNTGGDGNYQTDAASTTFNDVLYCIRTDLNVIACP